MPYDGCGFSDIYLLSNADMNKVMQSNPLILNKSISAFALTDNSNSLDIANMMLLDSVYGYVKISVEQISVRFGLAPIMYDDGSYSYSSLNIICVNDSQIIAPFELIESIPVPTGE